MLSSLDIASHRKGNARSRWLILNEKITTPVQRLPNKSLVCGVGLRRNPLLGLTLYLRIVFEIRGVHLGVRLPPSKISSLPHSLRSSRKMKALESTEEPRASHMKQIPSQQKPQTQNSFRMDIFFYFCTQNNRIYLSILREYLM